MKIIFIHGMNQQKYNALSLKQHWIDIFKQGLACSQFDIGIDNFQIDMAFYADLIQQLNLHNHLDLNHLLAQQHFTFPLALKFPFHLPWATHANHTLQIALENTAQAAVMPTAIAALNDSTGSASNTSLTKHVMPQPIDFGSDPDQIPVLPIFHPIRTPDLSTRLSIYGQRIKDHLLREVVAMMSHFPKLHAELIHEFLIETYLYLSNPEFMQQVHKRIQACFAPGQQHLIVAHSLGSVIAYNFLQQHPQYQVRGLLSLGSPLAFQVIHDSIVHPISHPTALNGPWHNFYSTEDFLTAYPLQKAPFDFHPAIINHAIETFEQSPHQIMGYLQHPEVVKCIVQLYQSA